MSNDTEADWDFVFVEAHTVGQDDWTTLPDQNGHTSQSTGPNDPDLASCPAGWRELHPWLDHYQTLNADDTCTPTGTTGVWNAASGNSSGWEQWSIDLVRLRGQAGRGLDRVRERLVDAGARRVRRRHRPSRPARPRPSRTGLGGWTVSGPPAGSAPNANDWIATTSDGFPEGAVISTPDTIYLGFGFEGISTPAARNAVMRRSIDYLLR